MLYSENIERLSILLLGSRDDVIQNMRRDAPTHYTSHDQCGLVTSQPKLAIQQMETWNSVAGIRKSLDQDINKCLLGFCWSRGVLIPAGTLDTIVFTLDSDLYKRPIYGLWSNRREIDQVSG